MILNPVNPANLVNLDGYRERVHRAQGSAHGIHR
jgi:hypothetical protein